MNFAKFLSTGFIEQSVGCFFQRDSLECYSWTILFEIFWMLLSFTRATLIRHFDCFMFRKSLLHIRNTLSAFFCYASAYIHHAIATECYAHVLSERRYAEAVIKKRVVLVHCHIVTCNFQTKFYSTVSVIVLGRPFSP